MKCKWCGSIYIYDLIRTLIELKFYTADKSKQEFIVLGCNDCGRITFIRKT